MSDSLGETVFAVCFCGGRQMISRTRTEDRVTQGILCFSCGFTMVTDFPVEASSEKSIELLFDKDPKPQLSDWERRVKLLMESEEQVLERYKGTRPFFKDKWDVEY